MIKIAIDGMGGDDAPQVICHGVNRALKEFNDIEVLLFGDKDQITPLVEPNDRLTIIHSEEVIEGDDEPVRAIRRKPKSSMVMAARAIRQKEADVLLSAGNTGALLASGLLLVGRIKHIDRPGLMPILPTASTERPQLLLMDAGANADCKAINLHQFAILANLYAKRVLNISQPKVGLVNNGAEASKGNELSKEAYKLLNQEERIDFVGNVESNELLTGRVDIAITDGFTGNAILKTLEGTGKVIFSQMKHQLLNSGVKAKLGGLLIKDALLNLRDQFDDSKAGGAILLGVKGAVIKAHGSSNEEAIFNAIRQARTVHQSQVIEEFTQYFEESTPINE